MQRRRRSDAQPSPEVPRSCARHRTLGLPKSQRSSRDMQQPASSGRPVAWHLGVLCAVLLSPMLGLGGFLLFQMAEGERARHQSVAHEAARQIAISLDRGLATYQAMLEVLATSDYLRAGNLAAFQDRSAEVPRPAGASIMLRDPSGRLLTSTGPSGPHRVGTGPSSKPDEAAVATGRPQISDVLMTTPQSFLVVAPVRTQDGTVRYLLELAVPTTVLGSLLSREEVPPGMVASLADRKGIVAARSSDAARYAGLRLPAQMLNGIGEEDYGWLRAEANDGTPSVAAYARSAISGWTTVVSLPEAVFAAPLRRSACLTTAFGLALGALAAALAHAFARRIALPIEALAGMAETAAAPAPGSPFATPVREVNAVAEVLAAAQAEARRRAAEREALLETLDQAQVFVRDHAGRITLWTAGMERLLGWTRAQAIGQVACDLLSTEYPRPLAELRTELVACGEWHGALCHRRADGQQVMVASQWALRRDGNGGTTEVVEACNDITALRETEAALRRNRDLLSSVLECSADSIFAKDRQGRYVLLNPSAADLLGTTAEAALGRRIEDLAPPGIAAQIDAADRVVIASGKAQMSEEEVSGPGGTQRNILTTKAPWRDTSGAMLGIVGVSRDITARRRAEARLQETQGELFRVARINAMGAMATAMAHELNQPLTAAANFAETASLLLRRDPPLEPAGYAAVRDLIGDSAGEVVRAGRILRRLREFVGRGDTEKRRADINAIIERAVSLVLSGMPDCGVALRLELSAAAPAVLVDSVQLQQVIVNLVRNAIEAMQEAPRRDLVVATRRHEDGAVAVSVADTGSGLSAGLDGRLFEPFVTTKQDGMGIGLSISRSIVEAHGGRLEAAARPGGGTVFHFVLPALPHGPDEEEQADAG
ncbi:MAG: PAS domain S-box protein [Acetobacteraceae bacterium]|nr:MAG: PAS domain S-box protein [Acetobacteraceae bacterium]